MFLIHTPHQLVVIMHQNLVYQPHEISRRRRRTLYCNPKLQMCIHLFVHSSNEWLNEWMNEWMNEWIHEPNKVLVCDSVSALHSLRSGISSSWQDLIYEVMTAHAEMRRQGIHIIFKRIPAHIGIIGKERVDKLAKQAVRRENVDTVNKLSRAEGKSVVWKKINKKWHQETQGRYFYSIHNRVGTVRRGWGCRKEEISITRLRILYTNLNSTLCIIGKQPTGLCNNCQKQETAEQVLVNAFIKISSFHQQLRLLWKLLYNHNFTLHNRPIWNNRNITVINKLLYNKNCDSLSW